MSHVRVYYFVEARWAIENIREQRLKVSRFFDLNDPFELFAGEQSDKPFRKKMSGWAEKVNQQEGLLCFTQSWRDPLMWSHYADRHRGMCLGFDVDDSLFARINYSPRRLPLDKWKHLNCAGPPKELKQLLLSTKCARWEYENERRVILPLASLRKENLNGKDLFFRCCDDKLRLVEVISGCQMLCQMETPH